MPEKSLASPARESIDSQERFKLARESMEIIACVGYNFDELRDKTVTSDWMIKQIEQTGGIESKVWREAAVNVVSKFSQNGFFELWRFNQLMGGMIFLSLLPVKSSVPETDSLIKLLKHVQSSAFDL